MTRTTWRRLLLLAVILTVQCSMFNVFAQIVIGGNVYGGGNAGDTGESTTVTVHAGDISAVYGGARMANVGGSTFVNIDGAQASADILIANVYGGNDISGTIGRSNVATTVPAALDNFEKSAGVNAIDNSWKTFIRTSPSVKYTPTQSTVGAVDKYMVVIGTLYGAGNGDYVYKDASGNDLKDGNNYIVRDATGATVATSTLPFSKPELSKTYLELKGGCIAHVYGGGNAATVTNNTTINIDNSSDDLQKAVTVWKAVNRPAEESLADVFNYLLTKVKISVTQSDLSSLAFNFARVFGGNNKADMAIRPKWNLQKGIIRDLYSGGNEGRMTSPEGLLLQIEGAGMTVQNVYGGCRKADVRPLYNNNDATPVPDDKIALNQDDNPNNIPAGYAARVRVLGGHVTNVYGGNDISGNVYGGNTIGILSHIYGNVYGGGNGSYAYTDNVKLKDDPNWHDFYYSPQDILGLSDDTFTGLQSAEALNIHRPNAEKVSILVRGTEDNPVTVDGSLYVGGNSASLREQTGTRGSNNKQTHIKIGSYVIIDNVFLGNNGENMVKYNAADASSGINEGVLRTFARTDLTTPASRFNSMDLTDKDVFAKYMEGCAMKVNPTVVFESIANGDVQNYEHYSTKFGSFFCGGNVGSILLDGKITVDFEDDVIIYDKVVGGCNNANVNATDYNAEYLGGMLGNYDPVPEGSPEGTIGDKLELNFSGLKIQPKRWNADHTALIWNTVSAASGEEVLPVTDNAVPFNPEKDRDRRLLGGNVYGGCYNSGHVNGNVVININQTLVDRRGQYSVFDETTETNGEAILDENENYTITQRRSGVILDIQGDDVLGKALNVFGGGYGPESEIWGSTTINVNGGYVFQVFGGGEQGPIGKSDPNGTYTYNYKIGGAAKSKKYSYDPRYSCYVNLKGNYPGTFYGDDALDNNNNDNVVDNPNMAEVEYLYGGAFEAPIAGNTIVNLGDGRIYQSFGGSCNADILGHTETYIGRQPKDDGTGYKDGFPWVRDDTYGANDMGGEIKNLDATNFKGRVSTDILGMVHGYSQNSSAPDVLQASAYTEYIQGRVNYIYGGAYGVYDYTDPHFKDYTYTTGATDIPEGTVLGSVRPGFYKPFADNAFVNFKPNNHTRNVVAKVFGGPEGSEGEIHKDLMQQRSYVLIDAPDVSYFQNMEVFGAGSYGGLGMNKTKAEAKADLDKVSAIIDLMRGKIASVYGGSWHQGMTRRTLVNVPEGSTINVASLFGGAYGSNPLIPCDVYEAIVNYHSEDATVRGNIYGGNNNADRTLYGKVNISVPVWQNKADGYLATVYGAGYGAESWSQYTEVNLTDGAQVYNVFGGGEDGQVLNLETIKKWHDTDPTLDLTIGQDYVDYGLNFPENDPDAYLVKTNGLGTKTNTNVYIGKGALVGYVTYKDDAQHPDGRQKIIYGGYAFGGGYGSSAIVSGTTYVGLHGGEVGKDIYGGGYGGSVLDDRSSKQFIAQTNAYIEGGTLRKVFGGGYEGHVGKHTGETVDGKFYAVAGSVMNDIPGETNVVIGIRKDQVFPDDYVYDNANQGDSLNYYKGVPTIQWNAYGAGEGGSVFGTTHLTLNNGYIGYYYDGIKTGANNKKYEAYLPKLNNETVAGTGGVDQLKDYGSVFGAGYDDKSSADFTDINIYGGVIRGSLYGGGEIATVGRGRTGVLTGLDRDVRDIYLTGSTRIELYNGHVMRHVFGGGKGYNLYGYGGTNELYTDGYVFGKTEVHIHGGEVGTAEGLAEGYGNVFGGGDVGFVYGAGYFDQYTAAEKTNVKGTTGSPNHWYYYASYKCNSNYGPYKVGDVISNVAFNTMSADEKAHWTAGKYLTEDCKVVVSPYLQIRKNGTSVSYDGETYGPYEYVPTAYLNTLPSDKSDSKWTNLYTGDKNSDGSVNPLDPVERGIQIRNAVFAGGNVSSNNDKTYANASTVFGNTTATLYDAYHRDFITVGTEHTGGLYGGGNLSMVDGYRELNITNYGTDYYGLDQKISFEEYQKLSNRERAYFQLKYSCITEYTSANGTTYSVDDQLTEEEYNDLIEAHSDEASYWTQYGFCSIYAGRLLNTIQRADFCGVYGSRMVLQGAKDRIAGGDNTPYTINRVGELSLNKQRSVVNGEVAAKAEHGNYFGIYSVVNYLGNLTSDVHFDDPYYKYDASHDQKELVSGTTYYSNKVDNMDNRSRNNGTCENQVALASGVFLELTTENSTQTKKDYGYVTGIVELDLINVKKDIEGGGYVYAKNEHRIPKYYPQKINVILSEYNQAKSIDGIEQRDDAITYKRYRYSSDGDWTETDDVEILGGSSNTPYALVEYETSGNFIHKKKPIVDDCYPNNGVYNDNEKSPAHYWYIKGTVYVYDQIISAYAGSASTYSKEVKIPLTITAGSNGRLKLLNIQPNLYAYYTDNNGSRVKLGTLGANNKPIDKVTVNNEMDSYKMNDVITWWDWNLLTESEQQYFVQETYVNVDTCTVDGVLYPEGTYVMLPTDSTTFKTTYINTNKVVDKKGNTVTKFFELFHPSNNISHDTGYVLTLDIDSPKDWDDWYSLANGTSTYSVAADGTVTTNRKKKEEFEDLSTDEKSLYREGPTYTLNSTAQSGLYGQRRYEESEIIPKEVYDDYTNTVSRMQPKPTGQAIVDEAYVALVATGNIQEGGAVPKSSVSDPGNNTNFDEALVCINTIQLGEEEYIVAGDLVAKSKKEELAAKYMAYNNSQLNMDEVTLDEARQYIEEHLTKAYYCKEAGLYGGQYFENSINYGALKTWCALTKDRDKFDYNYDALDVLVDPEYHGEGNIATYYHSPYSDIKAVEYDAYYTGTGTLNYTYKNGSSGSISSGQKLSRELYENIENEQSHYSRIEVAAGGQTVHIAKETFIDAGSPYAKGRVISEKDYKALSTAGKAKVENVEFTNSSNTDKRTVYYCYEDYTPVTTTITPESGTLGKKGSVISQTAFSSHLKNFQKDFVVQGSEPTETTTLYVSRESNAKDVTSEKVISVVYQYTYYENDDEGDGVNMVNELHVVNIHLQLESGVPEVGTLNTPPTVLPGNTVGLKAPTVNPGFYEIINNGWELYSNETDAENHRNGVPFTNNSTPVYWYQNQKRWVAFYSRTYLGKTYSNSVKLSVANYHDLDAVMKDNEHHLYVDHPDVMRNSKIYIDNRTCESDATKSELDLLKDFFDLSMQTAVATSGATKDHALLNDHVKGGADLEFILNSNVSPKAYTNWTPIGNASQCFEGTFHGDGYTISGLDHSLFGHLCGDVFNLGVTGNFVSTGEDAADAGIAETGSGYVENCWVSNSNTGAKHSKPIFSEPTGSDAKRPYRIVNCYYEEEADATNKYTNHSSTYGIPTRADKRAFYNGTVAYNLNSSYLNKRYYDKLYAGQTNPTGNTYYYLPIDKTKNDNSLVENLVVGYYPNLGDNDVSPCAQYGYAGYVEDRYANEDFIYAGGKVPETIDVRQRSISTTGGNFEICYAPIWPDDYIFFGQKLTFGHDGYDDNYQSGHEDLPSHVVKSSGRLLQNEESNRVYRAPAYFRNSTMDVAHFNPRAYLAAYSAPKTPTDVDLTPAYPNMTAIDFAGHNDADYALGSTSAPWFYPPLLDDDGLVGIDNKGETLNLLVYAPAADVNEKTYNVLNAYFLDPSYDDYDEPGEGITNDHFTDGKLYGRVAVASTSSIHGHLVQSDLKTTTDHLLVDKQDFNCPIAYTVGSGYRMWYQREPDRFVDRTKGWEGVSLPFSAEIVTTQDKGEITHFYQGSTTGHEYWLRGFSGGTVNSNVFEATFNPLAEGANEKKYTNTFLWDYYYSKDSYQDKNTDEYQKQYYSENYLNELYPVTNYPYSQAGTPYLIGFPSATYYEFDLGGEFVPKNTHSAIAKLDKQTVTFASVEGASVGISDNETGVTANGYTFKPTYLNNPQLETGKAVFLLDNDGDSFDKTAAGDVTITAFRPYFIGTASGTRAIEQIVFGQSDGSFGVEERGDPSEGLNGSLYIYAKKGKIIVESSLNFTEDVRVVTPAGITVASFAVKPGQKVEVQADFSGMYVVHTLDGRYTKKVAIKRE